MAGLSGVVPRACRRSSPTGDGRLFFYMDVTVFPWIKIEREEGKVLVIDAVSKEHSYADHIHPTHLRRYGNEFVNKIHTPG